MIKAICGVSGKFKVLPLVLPYGDMCSPNPCQQMVLAHSFLVPNLWTKMSAAWRTGYENRPSRSFDLAAESSRFVFSGN